MARIGLWGALLAAVLAVLFPFFWIFLTSLKPPDLVARPEVWAFTPVPDNWQQVMFDSSVPRYIANSLLVAVLTVTITLLVGCPAAYSFSRFKTGGGTARFAILTAEMMPPAILIVPFFLLMYRLALIGTLWAVVAAHLTFVAPLVTWFLIGFFDAVPRELEEQAMVDGYTRFAAWRKVVLPAIRPGIAGAAIFAFVLSWNDMFYALILTGGDNKTLPVAVAGYWTFRGIEMGKMAVAILLAVIPVLVAAFFVQKHLVRGLGAGTVKM